MYSQDPPSYDAATGQGHSCAYNVEAPLRPSRSHIVYFLDAGPSYSQPHMQTSEGLNKRNGHSDAKQPPQPKAPGPIPSMNTPTVYNYVHPVTKQHIASLLPPNHPEMICLQQGAHIPVTRYGVLGE